ncbi:MAG: ArsR family transcriptional regulator [Haloarculaceae archaeon]
MNETRERIDARIREAPGVHFRGLVRDLDLAPGQVQYHLRRLEASDRVASTTVRGRTHYFPPEVDPTQRRAVALLRRETARDAVAVLASQGPTPPAEVAETIDVARSTLEHHLEGLVAEALVRKEYDSRGRVTLLLADEERVARAIASVRPTLPERLVDRFTRLVDNLLED